MALAAVSEDALLGGEIMYESGLSLAACGDLPAARQAWGAALDAFERIGAMDWVERVRAEMLEEPSSSPPA
jgi:hypothetical protein